MEVGWRLVGVPSQHLIGNDDSSRSASFDNRNGLDGKVRGDLIWSRSCLFCC
jgi:hypothetical protein